MIIEEDKEIQMAEHTTPSLSIELSQEGPQETSVIVNQAEEGNSGQANQSPEADSSETLNEEVTPVEAGGG